MNTPEDIFQYASGYIGIIFGGLGAAIYYNMIAGILRAVGDSRTPLYFLIFSSVLNVVLDLAAVLVFHGGVEGAASWLPRSSAIGTHGGNIRTSGRNGGTGLKVFPRAGST